MLGYNLQRNLPIIIDYLYSIGKCCSYNKISIYDHKIETSLMGIEHLSIKIKEMLLTISLYKYKRKAKIID